MTIFQVKMCQPVPPRFLGWRGRSGTVGGRSPRCFFWILPKRSIPQADQHKKDNYYALMLQELMNSNYTRHHIELINGSFGGWLVSSLL